MPLLAPLCTTTRTTYPNTCHILTCPKATEHNNMAKNIQCNKSISVRLMFMLYLELDAHSGAEEVTSVDHDAGQYFNSE